MRTRQDWEREQRQAEALYEMRKLALKVAQTIADLMNTSAYDSALEVLRLELGEAQAELQRLDEEYNELSAEESPI